jgi:p-hydroxybenzoate 3-monooxygenase
VTRIETQVIIIGGGPAGLLLSQLLDLSGVASVVIEQRSKQHVLDRIRAGVVEFGSAQVLRDAGVGARMDREGFVHSGTMIAFDGDALRIDFREHTEKTVMVYGQTEITKDLYDARRARGGLVVNDADDVLLHDAATNRPRVTYRRGGESFEVIGRFVAGCDGFHGISRAAIPDSVLRTYELVYPFGWLGILSETPPVDHELIYANHVDGFALCSMRNPQLSRYYVQCSLDDRVENWSDERFWDALRSRLPSDVARRLVTGPSIEKSIAPLRSFVAEPLRYGSLFLAGDAAHIVPPTGAKGLNLAISDVAVLSEAFAAFFQTGRSDGIDAYSAVALARVWKAVRFSWSMTTLLHRFPDDAGTIRPRLQRAEFDYLVSSRAAQASLAENYVGLPLRS